MTDLLTSPITVGNVTLRNRVLLAPMSGVTDLPMRQRAWQAGAGAVISEMIASKEYCQADQESRRRASMDLESGGPKILQLAGRDPYWMRQAAHIASQEGVDIIDINMGCPAKKVTGGLSGSALMREPDLALSLIEATVEGARVPVTVKMRLGWDQNSINAPQLAVRAQGAGAAMITVHGRTRQQFYTGQADWSAVAAVVAHVSIPVVVNGDILTRTDAETAVIKSGAAAVMVGRAHYGAPWAAGAMATSGNAGKFGAELDVPAYIASHYEAMLSHYGHQRGVRHARKHLGWYGARFGANKELLAALMTETDGGRVLMAIGDAFAQTSAKQAA